MNISVSEHRRLYEAAMFGTRPIPSPMVWWTNGRVLNLLLDTDRFDDTKAYRLSRAGVEECGDFA